MSESNKNVPQQSNTQPEANGGGERMFTQDEVNRIVGERLERERAKAQPTAEEIRTRELNERESKLSCREYLAEKGYRAELLDILKTDDAEHFKQTVDKLIALCPDLNASAAPVPRVVSATRGGSTSHEDLIASVFKPKI